VFGQLRKMKTDLVIPVVYQLPLSDQLLPLNPLIGQHLKLVHSGKIKCIHCSREIKKSFNQGYCYPCFISLAQCDMCIVKPEQCHYDQGTCREPEWGLAHCMQPHYVYLANSSGIKVGITRHTQIPTRWIDQGAIQALPIIKAQSRYISGLVEIAISEHISDRTSWQKMLKNQTVEVDLQDKRNELLEVCKQQIDAVTERLGSQAIEILADEKPVNIEYPVLTYPTKVKSFNLDKTPEISGNLMGIKGQYLIFDSGVINIRKYAGYEVSLEIVA
jgi:uncharacterized protein DUF2797